MRFYIAWVDEEDSTFGPEHQVKDVLVRSFRLREQEGSFATLEAEIPNPRVGLLAPGRKQWVHFSVDTGMTSLGVLHLFFGRLTAAPLAFNGEFLTLSFQARPSDYNARKAAVAALLRVAPYYDPIWVTADRRADPDAVLEFYPKFYHCDRVTHDVTASDLITGEGGSIDFGKRFRYSSLNASAGSPPLRAIKVEGQVTWDQKAKGTVDISRMLIDAFTAAGSGNGWTITSLSGGGLAEDWPAKGDDIGEGWKVGDSSVTRVDNLVVEQGFVTVLAPNESGKIPVWTMVPVLKADYDVTRQRSERVRFTLRADCQEVINASADETETIVTLASPDADQPIDSGNLMPIRDQRRRAYFTTARGKQSLTALIARARAQLLERARAVTVSAEVKFLDALEAGIDCRKNARFEDPRLPGGEAAGKVTGYELSLAGDNMTPRAIVTIGCTVGKGSTVSADPGEGAYAEDDYAEDDWQERIGEFIMPIAGEVRYGALTTPPNDDGVNFSAMTAAANVENITIANGEAMQRFAIEEIAEVTSVAQAAQVLNEAYTEAIVEMRKLTAPSVFETIYNVDVSQLMVPQTVNLEAAA